ncbi:MAG: long-chain fatty acid--CoA ligase [Deltaproteobacteria bacterium]|nr:MAG: long-chain fatty acid--CoA ligase [Deltaproteobacteria bacterium]
MFVDRASDTPNAEAYRFPADGTWRSLTWLDALDRVRAISGGLRAFGLTAEQRVGVLSSTRYEWILADLGVLCAGGATTTVYPSNTAEECAYILSDSDAVMVFAEDDDQIAKLRAQRDNLPKVAKVVTFDGTPDGDWVISLAELEDRGRRAHDASPAEFDRVVDGVKPEDLATLIYTSGTTGKPKGVRLVHECWTYEAEAMAALGIMSPSDLQYLWLPLSHSFGKVLQVGQIRIGFPTAVDGRIDKLVDNLAVVRPTFMAAAPRIFEKVHNKVVQGAKDAGGLKYAIFKWAVGVGRRVSKLRQQGREPTGLLALQFRIADKLVFSKLKARFGGRVRFFISGSAPLSKDIAEFFHAADILILEGYGLTETSAASFVNRPDKFRFGTVGFPLPGTEFQLAPEDSEIWIRSPGVMRGYHNLPEQTAEVLTEDGWLKTGDIGEVDADRFLKITDRKKDLIKTSGGKYVAPQLIESKLKSLCPYVSQVIVHGDKRKYVTALVTLDDENIRNWARGVGLGDATLEELAASDQVRQLLQPYFDELNAGLARYETVKKFAILPRDLSVEEGELTPSLKVKRKAVEQRYMHLLDALYDEATVSL